MEKTFRLLTLSILNLFDVSNSNVIQQMECRTKESERMCCDICTSSCTFVRHKGNRCAFPLKYKGRRLSDNRSFVDELNATLGDGLKMTITVLSLLRSFSLGEVIPGER
ncbi:hypothetical protein AVEN_110686-1 [Araneus ventricosus]|uniref:Uncharacterized protein n=1 Tax=Araneus ventricosus TaxID=182803 RepID=A0A4Y2AWA9_ARAVE|nr:hypothetical protein AVEN_110686-1 [Araneus ventricosus]